MDKLTKKLLLKFDDEFGREYPKDCIHKGKWERVRKVKIIIEDTLKIKLDIDENVQDASFFTQLFVLEKNQQEEGEKTGCFTHCFDLSIRFSSFGNMVTVFSNSGKSISEEYCSDKIIEIFENNDYIYIKSSELNEPYDGINKSFRKGDTWWDRYFDYI